MSDQVSESDSKDNILSKKSSTLGGKQVSEYEKLCEHYSHFLRDKNNKCRVFLKSID